MAASTIGLTGCAEKDKVSWNVSQEADDFNAVRRLTVTNTLSDKVLLQVTGTFAVQTDPDTNELQVICELTDPSAWKLAVADNERPLDRCRELEAENARLKAALAKGVER